MRRQLFVHCLLLALCNAGSVLAEKNPQTDVGAFSKHEVTLEVANTVTTGAEHGGKSDPSAQGADAGQRPLILAVKSDSSPSGKTDNGSKSTKEISKDPELESLSFQELNNDAENLLREVLDLSSDMHILEEQHTNPAKNQLVVLVTLQPSSFFELDYVEVKVDGQRVAGHPYTENEIAALVRGGGHRIYVANLPAGMHELQAMFVGKVPRDPDYQREAKFKFISGVDRTVIELYVNSADVNGFPQFTVREWN